MTIVSGKAIVQTARDHGYAVGAFNTNNLEWTQAILRVAQLIRNLDDALNITVPIAIHLDHGDYEAAKAARYSSWFYVGYV